MFEVIGACWLLTVLVVLGVDHVLHARKARSSLHGPDETNVPAHATRAPDAIRTAA